MPSPLARPRGPLRRAAERASVILLILVLLLASPSSSAPNNASNDEKMIEMMTTTMTPSTMTTTSAQPLPSPLLLPPPPRPRRRPRPVVLWHGMGDSCCDPRSMGAIAEAIRRELPGTRVLSLDTSFGGGGAADANRDVWSGFFADVSSQVERACRWLRGHPAIRASEDGEFDAVGFSQGGLFLRAMVQRCGGGSGGGGGGGGNDDASSSSPSSSFAPRARTIITLGSPHQGVTAFPTCDPPAVVLGDQAEGTAAGAAFAPAAPYLSNLSSPSFFCRAAEALIQRGAFAPGVRDRVVQAQYFKPDADPDPFDAAATRERERYLEFSPFLPRVNCEEEEEGAREKKSGASLLPSPPRSRNSSSGGGMKPLASLRRLVLFRFYADAVVVPRDSAWFSELRRGRVVPLRQTPLFAGGGGEGRGDPLGLRALDEAGRLELRTAPGSHMRFSVDWFVREVVRPFLGGDDDGDDDEREMEAAAEGGKPETS